MAGAKWTVEKMVAIIDAYSEKMVLGTTAVLTFLLNSARARSVLVRAPSLDAALVPLHARKEFFLNQHSLHCRSAIRGNSRSFAQNGGC